MAKTEENLTTEQIIEQRRKMYEHDLFFYGKQIEEQKRIRHEAESNERRLKSEFLKKYRCYSVGDRIDYEFTINYKGQPFKQREIVVVTEIKLHFNVDIMQFDIMYIGKRTNKDGFTMNKRTSYEKKIWQSFLSRPTTTVYHRPENKGNK